ncbi:MAG: hypothetical protein NZ899_10710 [Thermoguttaceae bacterium]|nr:hypothetical protein [Thermoguttaceae bacterium]MDW8078939.1 hypothetical protein [Thermoguttaceae bacterium]
MFPVEEKRQIVAVLLALGAVAGWFVIGVLPRHKEISRLRAELARTGHLWEEEARLSAEVVSLRSALGRAEGLLAQVTPSAGLSGGRLDLLSTVIEAASSTGITLTQLSPLRQTSETSLSSSAESLQITWKGSFPQCVQFLRKLESNPGAPFVVELSCRTKEPKGEELEIEAICEEKTNQDSSEQFSQVIGEKAGDAADR